jgi:hypothetical protein
VIDAATGTVLDSRTVSGFQGGKYLSWNLSGWHAPDFWSRSRGCPAYPVCDGGGSLATSAVAHRAANTAGATYPSEL